MNDPVRELLGDIPHLTAKQTAVLHVLAIHIGEFVTVDEILERIWGEDAISADHRTVAVHVCALRKKIAPHQIRSNWGLGIKSGYKLVLKLEAT